MPVTPGRSFVSACLFSCVAGGGHPPWPGLLPRCDAGGHARSAGAAPVLQCAAPAPGYAAETPTRWRGRTELIAPPASALARSYGQPGGSCRPASDSDERPELRVRRGGPTVAYSCTPASRHGGAAWRRCEPGPPVFAATAGKMPISRRSRTDFSSRSRAASCRPAKSCRSRTWLRCCPPTPVREQDSQLKLMARFRHPQANPGLGPLTLFAYQRIAGSGLAGCSVRAVAERGRGGGDFHESVELGDGLAVRLPGVR
jgi:hypothetical protein